MEYLPILTTILLVHILGLISPGPDFIMIIRNSLTYNRKVGIFTAIGIGLGVIVHIIYNVAGLAFIISKSILLFNAIKLLGAGYLIYIGIKSYLAKPADINIEKEQNKKNLSAFKALQIGFLTNVLNPKATLYFLSIFTFVIDPDLPIQFMFIVAIMMIITTMIWFSIVATFFTHEKIQSKAKSIQGHLNKTFGALLVALGIKVALSEK